MQVPAHEPPPTHATTTVGDETISIVGYPAPEIASDSPEPPAPGRAHHRRHEGWSRLDVATIAATVGPVAILALCLAWDWRSPGLYMDSINPEYLARWILTGDDGIRWIIPGNDLFGRLPVFTGSVYHGSTQLYFSLPFFAVLGVGLSSWRIVQFFAAAIIVVLLGKLVLGSSSDKRLGAFIAALVSTALVLDPGFTMALRTQAYSNLFPVALFLGSLVLIRVGTVGEPSSRARAISGLLFGLSCFSYFTMWMFLPAMFYVAWSKASGDARKRGRHLLYWAAGVVVGYLPFALGIALIARELGPSGAVEYLRNMSSDLHVGPRSSGLIDRLEHLARTVRWTLAGDWVSLTIVRRFASTAGLVRAVVGGVLISCAFVLSLRRKRANSGEALVQAGVALITSFCVISLFLGDRLQGHHFAAIVPLWYLTLGGALVVIVDRLRASSLRWNVHVSTGLIVGLVAIVAAIGLAGLFEQSRLHRELSKSGGFGLYSDRITEVVDELGRTADGATVLTPDWGYAFAIQLVSGDDTNVAAVPATPEVVRQEACEDGHVFVVTNVASALDAQLLGQQSGTIPAEVEVWSSDDGVPLFQVARFEASGRC